jgi:lysophospholipase L1-like esterase
VGILLKLAATAFLVLAGGPGPATPPTPAATAEGADGSGIPPAVESEGVPPVAARGPRRALVVGDSLAVGVEPYLGEDLPGWRITTSAAISRPLSDGVAEITRTSRLPPVIVVSLGTNDDPSAVSSFSAGVESVLRAAGPSGCVVWPNIVRPPYNGVSYAGYNRALARLAAAQPNLIVVDWAGIAASDPGMIAPDGVHATSSGYRARAQAIAQAVLSCAG